MITKNEIMYSRQCAKCGCIAHFKNKSVVDLLRRLKGEVKDSIGGIACNHDKKCKCYRDIQKVIDFIFKVEEK